jgi:hypothetical protein
MRAVKLKLSRNVSRFLAETSGGMHHFAGDCVDLAGREPFGMFALAAPSEKGN